MIKIKPLKQRAKKTKPHYLLVFNYMIGDANGKTEKIVKAQINNPYIERFCTLLNSLKPLKGHWGICFRDETNPHAFFEAKQITKDDRDFLNQTMYEEFEEVALEEEHLVFYNGIRGDAEYSFLVFQGVDLLYIDEFGVKHETEFK